MSSSSILDDGRDDFDTNLSAYMDTTEFEAPFVTGITGTPVASSTGESISPSMPPASHGSPYQVSSPGTAGTTPTHTPVIDNSAWSPPAQRSIPSVPQAASAVTSSAPATTAVSSPVSSASPMTSPVSNAPSTAMHERRTISQNPPPLPARVSSPFDKPHELRPARSQNRLQRNPAIVRGRAASNASDSSYQSRTQRPSYPSAHAYAQTRQESMTSDTSSSNDAHVLDTRAAELPLSPNASVHRSAHESSPPSRTGSVRSTHSLRMGPVHTPPPIMRVASAGGVHDASMRAALSTPSMDTTADAGARGHAASLSPLNIDGKPRLPTSVPTEFSLLSRALPITKRSISSPMPSQTAPSMERDVLSTMSSPRTPERRLHSQSIDTLMEDATEGNTSIEASFRLSGSAAEENRTAISSTASSSVSSSSSPASSLSRSGSVSSEYSEDAEQVRSNDPGSPSIYDKEDWHASEHERENQGAASGQRASPEESRDRADDKTHHVRTQRSEEGLALSSSEASDLFAAPKLITSAPSTTSLARPVSTTDEHGLHVYQRETALGSPHPSPSSLPTPKSQFLTSPQSDTSRMFSSPVDELFDAFASALSDLGLDQPEPMQGLEDVSVSYRDDQYPGGSEGLPSMPSTLESMLPPTALSSAEHKSAPSAGSVQHVPAESKSPAPSVQHHSTPHISGASQAAQPSLTSKDSDAAATETAGTQPEKVLVYGHNVWWPHSFDVSTNLNYDSVAPLQRSRLFADAANDLLSRPSHMGMWVQHVKSQRPNQPDALSRLVIQDQLRELEAALTPRLDEPDDTATVAGGTTRHELPLPTNIPYPLLAKAQSAAHPNPGISLAHQPQYSPRKSQAPSSTLVQSSTAFLMNRLERGKDFFSSSAAATPHSNVTRPLSRTPAQTTYASTPPADMSRTKSSLRNAALPMGLGIMQRTSSHTTSADVPAPFSMSAREPTSNAALIRMRDALPDIDEATAKNYLLRSQGDDVRAIVRIKNTVSPTRGCVYAYMFCSQNTWRTIRRMTRRNVVVCSLERREHGKISRGLNACVIADFIFIYIIG
mgnify:CR=1 FL=1